jgi:hypothetical protein
MQSYYEVVNSHNTNASTPSSQSSYVCIPSMLKAISSTTLALKVRIQSHQPSTFRPIKCNVTRTLISTPPAYCTQIHPSQPPPPQPAPSVFQSASLPPIQIPPPPPEPRADTYQPHLTLSQPTCTMYAPCQCHRIPPRNRPFSYMYNRGTHTHTRCRSTYVLDSPRLSPGPCVTR